MIPLDVFGSESLAADLLRQVRWYDGVECPRYRSDWTVRNGSYEVLQCHLCKNYDRTFNGRTGIVFVHLRVVLCKWLLSIYTLLRFNTSSRQLQWEIDATHKTMHRRVERFTRVLDAPRLNLVGLVKVDEMYASVGSKGREHGSWSRSRGLFTRGRGSYGGDKPSVFTIVDHGVGQRYVVPAKFTDESTVWLLLADHKKESLTTYTDGSRIYDPLEDGNEFIREYVAHGDDEYVDGGAHVNNCESHASLVRRWPLSHWGVSKDKLTQYLRVFQLHSEPFRKPDREALEHAVKAALRNQQCVIHERSPLD